MFQSVDDLESSIKHDSAHEQFNAEEAQKSVSKFASQSAPEPAHESDYEDEQTFDLNNQQIRRKYCVGNIISTTFGLQHMGEDIKIEINDPLCVKIVIDERGYNCHKNTIDLLDTPYYFTHEPRKWLIRLGYKQGLG